MPVTSVKEFLANQGIDYEIILHRRTDTTQGTATACHIPASRLAKTVITKIDGVPHMVVVPGSERVDLEFLKAATGAKSVMLASEAEFRAWFPDCEPGAMPPFGNLYGLPVLVDESLTVSPQIMFNAGSHTEIVCLAYKDFARLAAPRVMALGMRAAAAKAA